ncbi:2-octaprenyl-6-methoxyphenyl hydroxylase [Agarilytica rhodophyticola]|uniref:2-octaprenyl-6-methoxyphenyl hydroxylase n=1 Tax=Agarilytica rhodophyticola TaxID=1737490 RepID=UPI000B349AF2|nr:2-octaprenyl-6-methoxyphenyl hydroxylase [Agarilytica rhodophyticola]
MSADRLETSTHQANYQEGSLQTDVAIVGGGMVGLSLALLVAHKIPDARISIIEHYPLDTSQSHTKKMYQPSFDERSTAISSNSATIFKQLGLWCDIQQHITPISRVHVTDRGHFGATSYAEQDNNNQSLGFVVDNRWLGYCLAQKTAQLPNIEIFAPANAKNISFHSGGATIELDGSNVSRGASHFPRELNCDLLVVADGAESELRQKMGIATEEDDYHQVAVIANVEFEHAHHGVAYERFTESGPLALLPLGARNSASKSALVWTTPKSKVDEVMGWDDHTFLTNLQSAFGYRLGHFTKVGERHHYSLKCVIAKEQVRSSMVLMGNAAHYLHPVAGQGFNLALRDCLHLSNQLAKQQQRGEPLGQLQGLQEYVANQQSDQWLTVNMSHNFNRLFTNENKAAQALRNVGLLGLGLFQPAKDTFFNRMMGKGARIF